MNIRNCHNCKQEFVIEAKDFEFYEKLDVPPPGICADCRMIRKLLWRNERVMYKRECGSCKKIILSMYHPKYESSVYCNPCYHADDWSGKDYEKEYDGNRPFVEQFSELFKKVPKVALHMGTQVPSPGTEYQNFAGGNKNCYLVFNATQNEECAYSRGIINSKNTCDSYFGDQTELCYENVNVSKSSKVAWSDNVSDSLNAYFCRDCSGVQNCFGCVNLRHQSYCIWNEKLEKEEWEKRIKEILGKNSTIEKIKKDFANFEKRFPRRASVSLKSVGCIGNFLYESKNCVSCYEIFNCEECKYGLFIKFAKDSYDLVGRGLQADLLLETVAVGSNCSKVIGTWNAETSHNIEYSFDMRSCHDCIGCVGMKHASFCILNKQHEEEEYKKLKERIVKELKEIGLYGLFFPIELSPWAYNETLAMELYPKSKEEILNQGFRYEEDIPRTRGKETVLSHQIADGIKEVQDDILSEVLSCEECGCNYRLIQNELYLLRALYLPIPRKCVNCRYDARLKRRGPFKLISRTCARCGKQVETPYTEEMAPILYCEACYQSEIM